MNNLEIYVNHAQPVVKTIKKHHNEFYTLWYYNLSPEDLFVKDASVEFMTQDRGECSVLKYLPKHFSGNIPMVYAQWDEVSGASMVLELSPENRKLLSPEVANTILGEQYKLWEDGVVYLLMDACRDSGFTVTEQIDPTNGGVGNALDFLSRRLGINYLNIHEARTDLEWKLQQ